jgi:hypothetical protein
METSALEVESRLIRPASAGLAYAILVFGVGFALGTLRVLIVAPRLGPTVAVLCETPVILGASWWVSRMCIARFQVSCAVAARLVMGLIAFMVLTFAEATLSVALFGRSVIEYAASLTTVPGAIGLAAQVVFAGFPLVQARLVSPTRGQHSGAKPTKP